MRPRWQTCTGEAYCPTTSVVRILILGGRGQLGRELGTALRRIGDVMVATRDGVLGRGQRVLAADLERPGELVALVRQSCPDVVVNAAAYTAVDEAEAEPDVALRVNGEAPAVLAAEAKRMGSLLVHFSTDYVFGGESHRPWRESDPTIPVNVYGRSKLRGEEGVCDSGCQYLIFRTSWLYARHGRNFVRTMLQKANERHVAVVNDQTGSPSWARPVAEATRAVLMRLRGRQSPADALGDRAGVYHLAANGETTWYHYARTVFQMAQASGLMTRVPDVVPVSSREYGAVARRPSYSVLDCTRVEQAFGCRIGTWTDSLADYVADLVETKNTRN